MTIEQPSCYGESDNYFEIEAVIQTTIANQNE